MNAERWGSKSVSRTGVTYIGATNPDAISLWVSVKIDKAQSSRRTVSTPKRTH